MIFSISKLLIGYLLLFSLLGLTPGLADDATPDEVLAAMEAELQRSMQQLSQQQEPAFYLSYEIVEVDHRGVATAYGMTVDRSEDRRRQLDIDLRVGSPQLDNTHPLRGNGARRRGRGESYQYIEVPMEGSGDALRASLWLHTDRAYKDAVERLTTVRTNVEVKVEESDGSPDFAADQPARRVERQLELALNIDRWQGVLERSGKVFAEHPEIFQGEASLRVQRQTRWYVNSEGSTLRTSRVSYRLDLAAFVKADDGMELPRYETYFAYRESDLPSEEELDTAVERMVADLLALRSAPVVDPYTGPAILSGRAAGVFFHEVFGHRVEGHRQKREDDGQTFKQKIGERILPESFSVVFDPTRPRWGDQDLAGHYRYDNEGVRAQSVTAVEDGVFRRFLMSRSPIEGQARSNGHGRRQPGYRAVSRQSNLIVESSAAVSREELKKRLLDKVEEQGRPFGLFFEDIQGGFTTTGRRAPNAFNVLPILVYRIYPDGREELVRGVDLIGTPAHRLQPHRGRRQQLRGIQRNLRSGIRRGAGLGRGPRCSARSDRSPAQGEIAGPAAAAAVAVVRGRVMSSRRWLWAAWALLAMIAGTVRADVLQQALQDEQGRSRTELQLGDGPRPYFLAYRVDDFEQKEYAARAGALMRSAESRQRYLSAEVRVGSPEADNTNYFSFPTGPVGVARAWRGTVRIPHDDDYHELRRYAWLLTDAAYKTAVEAYSAKAAVLESRTLEEELPDFTAADPVRIDDVVPGRLPSREAAEDLVRELSQVFRGRPAVQISEVVLRVLDHETRLLNSEGTSFHRSAPVLELIVAAVTQAQDGRPLHDGAAFYARSWEQLPDFEELKRRAEAVVDRLAQTGAAASPERYNGPVLFEGEAAAEIFARAFVPHLAAWRPPISEDPGLERRLAQLDSALTDRIGGRVLARSLRLVDDPLRESVSGAAMLGGFRVDDDGVPAQPTTVVERGILKALLATRTPSRAAGRSTGSRRGAGAMASNLILDHRQRACRGRHAGGDAAIGR